MIKSILIADDLTGANATGALLAKNGLKVGTLTREINVKEYVEFDVLAISTNSRGIMKEKAYERVCEVMESLKGEGVGFYNKRIDSTLRGNVGAEIDGILDKLDEKTVAIVVASFPSSGRVSLGGYLLVNGIPLEKTAVANDPTSPVKKSKIVNIIAQQSKYEVGYLSLEIVMQGKQQIITSLQELVHNHKRVIVVDACTDEDIKEIAQAALSSGIKFVTVDPGPFTEAVLKEQISNKEEKVKQKLLFAINSVSELTRTQIQALMHEFNPYIVKVDAKAFLRDESRRKEILRTVDDIFLYLNDYQVFVVTTTLDKSDVLDLHKEAGEANITVSQASELITLAIAEIVEMIIKVTREQIGGIYTSGGDVTVALCERIEAKGFEVKGEIIPLAVYGHLMGGKYDQGRMITKGGLIGDSETLVMCANYMLAKLQG